ncbi:uncharacterized protein EI97DRAFT_217111 [Westerdykella ornata]|uniref:Uncharacterized protein n=1 Tax=Westerdykella ornata TaxID=318751 RepID=A0A6A6JS66_WESOR|nr:uncharacterized protein EI97DRAFT_217111 [Westerdykella ornata]KAF2278708.1 hypothetical protein EI97DRAFT_217111 [Westerdykella ornata]
MSGRPEGLANASVLAEYSNPNDGRRLVYYIVHGTTYAEDRIFKYLEYVPQDPGGPIFYKELPANWINRFHQYQQETHQSGANGRTSEAPKDVDHEEQKAFDALYQSRGKGKKSRGPRRDGSRPSALRHKIEEVEVEADEEPSESSENMAAVPPSKPNDDHDDSDTTMLGVESDTKDDEKHELGPLLRLPATIRSRILADVLRYRMVGPPLALHDIASLPAVFHTCRQLRLESWKLWVRYPLHILSPLPRDVNRTTRAQLAGIEAIYGSEIPRLTLYARVINQITANSIEQLVRKLANEPGLGPESRVLYPEADETGSQRLSIYAPNVLVRKMRDSPERFALGSRYCLSYAPTNHLNIFGWMRYAELTVSHLTIQLQGAAMWNDAATGDISANGGLAIIAAIASIIAFKPKGIETITLRGLTGFCDVVHDMWHSIPDRTPLVGGRNKLLDGLVKYPFADYYCDIKEVVPDGDGGLTKRPRWGNMFGLMSEFQWQSMILMTRYGKHYPSWEFVA